ncbi:MAG TPA: vWA domain-containing protein [Kofleriaceae bacterium]|nr:vWA domain-containing protein [Kofleriaceae bacterium]
MRSPIFLEPDFRLVAAASAALFLLPACPDREVAEVHPFQIGAHPTVIPLGNNDLDILFVIDNSSSMLEEQESLAQNFNTFIDVLESAEGGLPDIHIGVVSTDMGAKAPGEPAIPNSAGPPGSGQTCDETGDGGKLQAAPRVAGCMPPTDPYISDIESNDDRVRNYSGDLAETFSCIARLGTEGCVFEQQLESMRAALDPAINPDFVRDGAYLAIVFITDEDDCSAQNPHIFNGDPALNTKGSELGYAISYRCFEFGVQCDQPVGRDPASYTGCTPRTDSPYLWNVQERYVDFLKNELGKPADKIILAAITGKIASDVDVIDRDRPDGVTDDVEVAPSCQSTGTGSAVPPVRISYLLDQFEDDHTYTAEICQADLREPIEDIANVIKEQVNATCLGGNLVDGDTETPGLQPDCSVTKVTGGEQVGTLTQCDASLSVTPCWRVEPGECEPDGGETYPAQLKLVVERNGQPPPVDTDLEVSCLVSG